MRKPCNSVKKKNRWLVAKCMYYKQKFYTLLLDLFSGQIYNYMYAKR